MLSCKAYVYMQNNGRIIVFFKLSMTLSMKTIASTYTTVQGSYISHDGHAEFTLRTK